MIQMKLDGVNNVWGGAWGSLWCGWPCVCGEAAPLMHDPPWWQVWAPPCPNTACPLLHGTAFAALSLASSLAIIHKCVSHEEADSLRRHEKSSWRLCATFVCSLLARIKFRKLWRCHLLTSLPKSHLHYSYTNTCNLKQASNMWSGAVYSNLSHQNNPSSASCFAMWWCQGSTVFFHWPASFSKVPGYRLPCLSECTLKCAMLLSKSPSALYEWLKTVRCQLTDMQCNGP